jgi:hypothetical protein
VCAVLKEYTAKEQIRPQDFPLLSVYGNAPAGIEGIRQNQHTRAVQACLNGHSMVCVIDDGCPSVKIVRRLDA